jgi:arylsulfatase
MVGKWHLGSPGPMERGFQHYFGFKDFGAHSEGQWNAAKYVRLPAAEKPELNYEAGRFFATDAFTDYACEFLRQARSETTKPWFLYLAHSSPHFPLQAPQASIDRNMATYRRGWDVLRAERFERMKKLGLVPANATLPARARVPVDRDDIANGYAGQLNPAWASLPADRREDLARRMATFAAMVEHVDRGIGRILADLEASGDLANTLILFTSDNGACYEWGPFGFDGASRTGKTTLHAGEQLTQMGQPGSFSSYGSGWANLGNTPLAMYKHFCSEGGIASPLIAHWPTAWPARGDWVRTPAHVMDFFPTIAEATGAVRPAEIAGVTLKPLSGVSLVPLLRGLAWPERGIPTAHEGARGYRLGQWKIVWGKRQAEPPHWELYDLAHDVGEERDLAASQPAKTAELAALWAAWAERVGVQPR